jgi:hypothetical protein
MSKQIWNLKWRLMAMTGLPLLAVTCADVPMTAPAGTMIFMQANPWFVAANGGTSVVTALLTEPAGTLVPDGTVVLFFTTLGRVDAQGKTKDGVAKVNFVSDSRSGQATVTAYSGGGAPAPAPSASATTSTFGSVTASASVSASAETGIDRTPTNKGEGSTSITIDIGSALPTKVAVTADPPYLTTSRQATITANVFDANGNPVQNVPVIFTLAASPLRETLASGGSPQYSDSNGRAFDRLTTSTANGTETKTVTVTATTANFQTGTVPVVVYYTTLR